MKVLVISRSFPPHVSGSSTIMGNLLKHFARDSYVVLCEEREPVDPTSRIDCVSFHCIIILRNYCGPGRMDRGSAFGVRCSVFAKPCALFVTRDRVRFIHSKRN